MGQNKIYSCKKLVDEPQLVFPSFWGLLDLSLKVSSEWPTQVSLDKFLVGRRSLQEKWRWTGCQNKQERQKKKGLAPKIPKNMDSGSNLSIYLSIYLSMYIYIIHIHMYVCMYVCMHACMYVYIYIIFQKGVLWAPKTNFVDIFNLLDVVYCFFCVHNTLCN